MCVSVCGRYSSGSQRSPGDPYTVADFDGTGNPFQNWGLGSWQGAAQSTLDGSAIGASTNWMEVDMGNLNGSNWNNTNELIMPWYGNWGSWTLDTLNQHSAYAFDVIAIDGTYNSNSLYVKMSADFYAEYGGAQLAPTVNQNWNQVPITLTSVEHMLLSNQPATITHVVVPYTGYFPDCDVFVWGYRWRSVAASLLATVL